MLFQDYLQATDGHYGNYAARMEFLAARIEAGFLQDTAVFVDGYSEFTPAERQVLTAMMRRCPQVTVCLCLDAAAAERTLMEEDVFYPTWHSYATLIDAAQKAGVAVAPPLCLSWEKGRFAANGELFAVEREFAVGPAPASSSPPQTIAIRQAMDREAELMAVGREIRRLVREEGLRYREIGLITRESAPYESLLPMVFQEMGIPYFVDSKKPLLYHPLVELVRSALEVWAYKPHYRQVMRFIKSALSPIAGEEADLLENYCLAHGVRFYHWQEEPWHFPLLGEEDAALLTRVNELKTKGALPLLHFLQKLARTADAAALNQALLALLEEMDVLSRLQARAEAARQEGRGTDAAEEAQAWEKLTAFLSEAQLLLGDAQFAPTEWLDLYDAAFSSLTFSTIPPGADQVLITSLERSRNPELRAAFVLNVNAGVLPRRMVADGLFRDEERRLLASYGIALAADTRLRQFQENYLCYIALTRCGERLYLSYLLADEQGSALSPSPIVGRLCRLFSALRPASQDEPVLSHLVGGSLDLELAAAKQREANPPEQKAFWRAVYAHYEADPAYGKILREVARGQFFRPEQTPLSRTSVQRLYGHTLHGSVSRLERFRMCPFSYFATYGLKLRPRKEYALTPKDQGDLFHQVLFDVGNYIRSQNLSWRDVDEKLARLLVDRSLEIYLPRFLSGILQSSSRYAYLEGRFRSALVRAVLLAAEQMKGGDFIPIAYELPFGQGEGGLPAFSLPLGDGRLLSLSGQIDRVDMAKSLDGGAAYFRIVDYKTGNISLTREEIAAGLKLQLLVYLQVVLANSQAFTPLPAQASGVYYAPIQDRMSTVEDASEADAEDGLKMIGLTLADPDAVFLADREIQGHSRLIPVGYNPEKGTFYANPSPLEKQELAAMQEQLLATLKETAAQMLDGMIQVAPVVDAKHDACRYCDFRAVCGFDRTQRQGACEEGQENGEEAED